jgi:dUTP pyrophosphatase
MTEGSAGADISACLPGAGLAIAPGETKLIPTGIAVEIPKGFEIQIRSRSGLSMAGLVVKNSPATIDSDYRGEIQVMVHNSGSVGRLFFHGDRVAQMVVAPVYKAKWEVVSELPPTSRGNNGFGSTDRKGRE